MLPISFSLFSCDHLSPWQHLYHYPSVLLNVSLIITFHNFTVSLSGSYQFAMFLANTRVPGRLCLSAHFLTKINSCLSGLPAFYFSHFLTHFSPCILLYFPVSQKRRWAACASPNPYLLLGRGVSLPPSAPERLSQQPAAHPAGFTVCCCFPPLLSLFTLWTD